MSIYKMCDKPASYNPLTTEIVRIVHYKMIARNGTDSKVILS